MATEQVSRLKFAAESSHVSAEALSSGMAKLAKTMSAAHTGNKIASESLEHFGITAENLHDPLFTMKEALDKIADKAKNSGDGFLKTGDAQKVMGRGAAQLIPLLNQGADGIEKYGQKADALHVTLTGPVQNAQRLVTQSFLDLHQAMEGVHNVIMTAMAPAFAEAVQWLTASVKEGGFLNETMHVVGEYLTSLGQRYRAVWQVAQPVLQQMGDMVRAVGGDFGTLGSIIGFLTDVTFSALLTALKVVSSAFSIVLASVKGVMSDVVMLVMKTSDGFKTLGQIVYDLVHGNFDKIKSDWAAGNQAMADDSAVHAGQIKSIYEDLGKTLKNTWAVHAGPVDDPLPVYKKEENKSNGNESTDDAKSGKAKKLKAAKDMFSEMKSQLEQLEDVEKVSDDKRLAYELNYWKAKLTTAKKGSAEYRQIFHEVAVLQREMAKKEAEEAKKAAAVKEQIIKTEAAGEIAHTKAMLAQKKAAVEGELALGQISKQEELRQLASFEKQAFDIELGALNDYIKTLTAGTAAYATALKDRQALNDSFNAQLQASNIAMAEAQSASIKAALAPVTSAIQQSVNGMIAGTTTMKQALGNIYKSILGEFVSMLAQQVAKWAAAQIAQTMAAMAGAATRVATAKVAAKATTAADRASGQSQISSAAATGAAKAYQAIVGIPYVGPILAPIAASVAFVGIEAFGSRLGSAAGGWGQVPHDQIASIHKDEMVLPADIAGPMRAMTKGGAMGGGGTTVNLQALDMRSLADALRRNPSALAGAVQHANRMGHF
jgi:hypothetical protein